jgi:hypothetical protein
MKSYDRMNDRRGQGGPGMTRRCGRVQGCRGLLIGKNKGTR